jgi:mannosyltransferase OCH1-like enzyme
MKSNLFYFKFKENYNPIVPLTIYQTWYTKDLVEKMSENVDKLKRQNPRFQHFLFDDHDCRNFIKQNFPEEVLIAFDSFKPGAYKADLWRYCILYIHGGIYLDIKYKCVNGFKFIALTEKEHFPSDVEITEYQGEPYKAVWNALIISKPKNEILLKAINQIVENVKNKYYGNSPLDITGPVMFGKFFTEEEKKNSLVKRYVGSQGNGASITNILILNEYPEYRDEQKTNTKHYQEYWKKRDVYY